MDGIPKLLDEILKQQARLNKLLDRCKKEGVAAKPLSCNLAEYCCGSLTRLSKLRDTQMIEKYLEDLAGKRDQIADIKSAHDADESLDNKKPDCKDPSPKYTLQHSLFGLGFRVYKG